MSDRAPTGEEETAVPHDAGASTPQRPRPPFVDAVAAPPPAPPAAGVTAGAAFIGAAAKNDDRLHLTAAVHTVPGGLALLPLRKAMS